MLTFTLAIFCLTTSNLPWFMDLTFQVPMQCCSSQHRTLHLSTVTSTTGCYFCVGSLPSFFLGLFLHWSWVAYWAPTHLGSSSFSVLSFCLFICSWGSQGKNTEEVCHSLLQWTTFCQNSPPRPVRIGWPYSAWLSFIELDKAVVHVIRLASFLWLWFTLSALLFPFSMPTLLVGFPLPWMWSISSPLLQQSTAAAPDLGRRVSPLGCRSWRGVSPLGLPAPRSHCSPTPLWCSWIG